MIKKSPYEILGLQGDFIFSDIKKAYRKAVRENPPEQNPKTFAEISHAYDMLTNEEYYFKDTRSELYALSVKLDIQEALKVDRSCYLKNIFEVPFKI